METTTNKNLATLLQLSALTQYVFPFGNLIFPALLWSLKRNDSEFIDYNGKQAINFQLSLFLYSFVLIITGVLIFIYTLMDNIDFKMRYGGDFLIEDFSMGKITWLVMIGIVACCIAVALKVAEFVLIIYASVKNSKGEKYNYPLTISFIR
ncbi:DUF4870 domain-containing protein [Flavobacterium sp. DG1-102-2]|uniref:DUF4870 domain-containing protein n=1 Tax=Flavobacterium sp. DG1-102-2 TaxID=3081663 RepID=UPI00294A68C7|nr:DUF4870 domain-containing protein [Flavobacterium sp. DG1-102-2]MDV6169847.1 DUF4870 domain-containing protein [Flavobacterium sp. DG1-102-2]